jgi:hypothetical protein
MRRQKCLVSGYSPLVFVLLGSGETAKRLFGFGALHIVSRSFWKGRALAIRQGLARRYEGDVLEWIGLVGFSDQGAIVRAEFASRGIGRVRAVSGFERTDVGAHRSRGRLSCSFRRRRAMRSRMRRVSFWTRGGNGAGVLMLIHASSGRP